MPDIETRLRRLTSIAVDMQDLVFGMPDFELRFRSLQERAAFTLSAGEKGNREHLMAARKLAQEATKEKGKATRARVLPIITAMKVENPTLSDGEIAKRLQEAGVAPPRSKHWSRSTVRFLTNSHK